MNLFCGGFLSSLTIVFIVLKLLEIITWSWFWVISPLLFGIIGSIATICILAYLVRNQ